MGFLACIGVISPFPFYYWLWRDPQTWVDLCGRERDPSKVMALVSHLLKVVQFISLFSVSTLSWPPPFYFWPLFIFGQFLNFRFFLNLPHFLLFFFFFSVVFSCFICYMEMYLDVDSGHNIFLDNVWTSLVYDFLHEYMRTLCILNHRTLQIGHGCSLQSSTLS